MKTAVFKRKVKSLPYGKRLENKEKQPLPLFFQERILKKGNKAIILFIWEKRGLLAL